jgi:5-methylcytosine-specific restriction endonuclease McrA
VSDEATPTLRASVQARAVHRREYCLLHEDDAVMPHELDHIIASQHGGQTTLENFALSCWDRNHVKGPNLASVDPLTGEIVLLFRVPGGSWCSDTNCCRSRRAKRWRTG